MCALVVRTLRNERPPTMPHHHQTLTLKLLQYTAQGRPCRPKLSSPHLDGWQLRTRLSVAHSVPHETFRALTGKLRSPRHNNHDHSERNCQLVRLRCPMSLTGTL